MNKPVFKVLFVCMGNICRSPTAHGVFMKFLQDKAPDLQVEVDSAGTHGYHVGGPADSRASEAASRRGYDLSELRARQVEANDFERFDLILAMDRSNHAHLLQLASSEHHERIRLFLEFATGIDETDVPDPYYGGDQGFERVLDMVEDASRGLLDYIRRHD